MHTNDRSMARVIQTFLLALCLGLLAGCRSDNATPAAPPSSSSSTGNQSKDTDPANCGLNFEINGVKWDGKSDLSSNTFSVTGD